MLQNTFRMQRFLWQSSPNRRRNCGSRKKSKVKCIMERRDRRSSTNGRKRFHCWIRSLMTIIKPQLPKNWRTKVQSLVEVSHWSPLFFIDWVKGWLRKLTISQKKLLQCLSNNLNHFKGSQSGAFLLHS